jgi:DNA modification methylase
MKTYLQLENKNRINLPEKYQEDDFRFSDSLVEFFLNEFTVEGDVVFDPFAGFGTTLIVAEEMRRVPYGIEYDAEQVQFIQSHLINPERIIHGDSRQLSSYELPPIDFSLTSPPYMTSYGQADPFTAYTEIGEGYPGYLKDIQSIYKQLAQKISPDAKVVIEVANIKKDIYVTTLAWDIAKSVSKVLLFEGEIIVNWDHYSTGYDHSYCLLFSKAAQT